MSLIRPEARAALIKHRDLIGAGLLAVFGLRWGLIGIGIVPWIGWVLVLIALAWGYVALQRLRFAQGGEGAGVVTIDERRVAYFGPLWGGVQDMDTLRQLDLTPAGLDAAHWTLTGENGDVLSIPVNALGADALFDLFAALPGIRTDSMLSALKSAPDQAVTIWRNETTSQVFRIH
jgi:hypothetical protein